MKIFYFKEFFVIVILAFLISFIHKSMATCIIYANCLDIEPIKVRIYVITH